MRCVPCAGASGGCTLERDGDLYRAVIAPLKPGEGITIGGIIASHIPVTEHADPLIPQRRSDDRLKLALATIPLGLISVAAVYSSARRRGSRMTYLLSMEAQWRSTS